MDQEQISEREQWRRDNGASVFETNDHFTHKRLKADLADVRETLEWAKNGFSEMDPQTIFVLNKLEGVVSTLLEHTTFLEPLRRRK
jgi:hypothetical protein